MGDSDSLLRSLATWSSDLPIFDRLTVLTDLVAYWHGDRVADPQPVVTNRPVPPALGWLYSEIAARNTDAFTRHGPDWVRGGPIMGFNSPRNPGRYQVDESGKITFLVEQQGVFRCGTPADEIDGPVFRQEMHGTSWRRCADRLSDFLLWEIVFELHVCRRDFLWGLFPPEAAAKITEGMLEVKTGNVSTYGVRHKVYHAHEVAMISTPSKDEVCLEPIARTREALAALKRMATWNGD
jgi:hypothetical protein